MPEQKTLKNIIPLSKSVANRLMILSLRDNDESYLKFLESYPSVLPDDIQVCKNVLTHWNYSGWVEVGESRTALIFLKEYARINNVEKLFTTKGTLKNRKLENTSQITSAKLLCGEIIPETKDETYHVRLTRKIIQLWNMGERTHIFNKIDETIWEQCLAMECIWLKGLESKFQIRSAEDVCLGYFMGKMTLEEIVEKFPSTIDHESNRPVELLKTLIQLKTGKAVSSKDHRVVMAASFYALIHNIEKLYFMFPACVNKSFPLWWDYLGMLKDKKGVILE